MEFEPNGRTLLAIFAHPDDAEFGSGGTIARWTDEGGEAVYLVCTDGAAGGTSPDHTPEWLRDTCEREQRAAAQSLGVSDVHFLRERDGELLPTLELRKQIARVIRRLKPDVALIPSPTRSWGPNTLRINHPDHLAVGEAAIAALYPGVGNAWTFTDLLGEGLQPHTVPEIWIVGTDRPDFPVDISGTIDRKLAAIYEHASQVAGREMEERMKGRAAVVGQPFGLPYAEAYLRLFVE